MFSALQENIHPSIVPADDTTIDDQADTSPTPPLSPSPFRVLYPGCHRHLTPLFFFPDITFVDVDSKIGGLYDNVQTDSSARTVLDYIHKTPFIASFVRILSSPQLIKSKLFRANLRTI